ncbi:MAG: F0F1 ATP synthase subunit B [Spirochaetaceae bacterium]|jgi:F-type H+-transporting ATPase subunit b|nr:F0F1 ATP synthase subunit B [Spirochaetaceae bacterium]
MLDFSITFLITFVNLAVLFVFLRKILFKPVTKFMESRTEKIQSEIIGIEKSRDEIRLMQQEYETKLKNAEAEAHELAKSVQESAQRNCNEIIAEAKVQAQNMLSSARKQIDAERQAAYIAFKAEAAALVVAATGKLLRREINSIDAEDAARMILGDLGKRF